MGEKKQRKAHEKRVRRLVASADDAAKRAEKAAAKAKKERKRAQAARKEAAAAEAPRSEAAPAKASKTPKAPKAPRASETPKTPKAPKSEPAPEAATGSRDLGSATKAELLELARAADVPGRSGMTKAELVAALES